MKTYQKISEARKAHPLFKDIFLNDLVSKNCTPNLSSPLKSLWSLVIEA